MAFAQSRGALGVLYLSSAPLANPNGDWIKGFYPGYVSHALADRLLCTRQETVSALKGRLQKTQKPISFSLNATLAVDIQAKHFPIAEGCNVAFYLQGSDVNVQQECVVVGAHLDHVGEHMGCLFPGADDNASGSAVVLEAAKALVASGLKPKRSIVFVFFGSEEPGCEGSRHFVDVLPSPFRSVTAMVNFDMVGVGDQLSVALSAPLEMAKGLLDQADQGISVVGRLSTIQHLGVRAGDIGPFYRKGAGIANCYSMGDRPTDTYHLPGDTPALVQDKILVNAAKWAYRYAFLLANR